MKSIWSPDMTPRKFNCFFALFVIGLLSHATLAQERTIEASGTLYHVYIKGFEHRKPGQPAIIFENGMGVGLGHWDTILDDVAKFAPVFAYDRAGSGKSEKVLATPTISRVAENLRSVLKSLNIPPPYILVGHSLGGVYIRGYAGLHPDEVSGLIFVDPADFLEEKADWKSLLISVGVAEKRADEMIYDRLYKPTAPDSVNFGPWSEVQVLGEMRKTDFAELNALPLPNVPIYFFVGGKFEVPKEHWSKDYDHPIFFKEKNENEY